MHFWKTKRTDILLGVCLIVIYLITRLVLLTNLPIFTDEAIYIRWSQIALHDVSWRFISLTDGKQPLFIWIMMGYLKLFHDPLYAGRLVSVTAGMGSMVGLWLLSYTLFKNKFVSWMSIVLYIFFPLALLHDRLAIYDSLVATLYIFALYFSIVLSRTISLSSAYTLGFAFGAGVLNKSIGFLSMALLPFVSLLFDFKQKHAKNKFLRLAVLGCFSILLGFLFYSILRLSPLFGIIDTKNGVFVYTISEWLQESIELRIAHFFGNLQGMVGWFGLYMSITYLLLLIIGLINKFFIREKLLLCVYFLLPFLYLAMFGKVLFPRYILFMSVILFPVVAFGLHQFVLRLQSRFKQLPAVPLLLLVTLLVILPNAYVDYVLVSDPLNAPISINDKGQYIDEWPAGWGIKEAVTFLSAQAVNQKIYVGTQGTFGLMPFAFEIYFTGNNNITTKAYWPIDKTIPDDLLQKAKQMPTYIYFYEPCNNCPSTGVAPASWPVVPIFTVAKNNDRLHATLYQVVPNAK